jgi:CBS domain-containing protein
MNIEELLLLSADRPPISIRPSATVRDAAMLMASHCIGAVLVLDEHDALIGIVSERDLLTRVVALYRNLDTTLVSDIMTTDVRTARESDSAEYAVEMMSAGHFRHLPVIDASGVVCGVVSIRDLLTEEVGALSRRNADLLNFISADGPGG